MRNILVLIPLLTLFTACTTQKKDINGKPNFVWIISEDNSKHYLELFDENGIETPNIAELADHGILFTRAFSNSPVCSVARSTLISGCYGPRIGTQYHRRSERVPMPDETEMFPAYLRELGYYTTNNSKEDYNIIKNDDVWDESSKKAHWRNRAGDQPFFHKESHSKSHESNLHFKKARMERHTTVDPDQVFLSPRHPDTETFRFTAAYYRDKILDIDTIVGEITEQLKEDGLLENTFIFYFGDHGGVLPGSKGFAYETGLHVPLVVRIPENYKHLVDIKPGSATGGFISFIDFGPTLLKLAGADIPEGIDGNPFLGRGIDEKELNARDVTFGYADRFDEKYDLVRTARKSNFKYMRNYQPFNPDGLHNRYRYLSLAYLEWREMYHKGQLNDVQKQFFEPRPAEELFDIDVDPYETNNLATDPSYSDKLEEMRSLLTEWVKGNPDLSFIPEPQLVKEAFDNPVVFGQDHIDEISKLVDIADLSLLPYENARNEIGKALSSDNYLEKYWGLIVCSSFGKEASEFYEKAKKLTGDENLLVRTRAAEFLGLTGSQNPKDVIRTALAETDDPVEANLILNTVVLLRDGPHKYEFDITEDLFKPEVQKGGYVIRRLEYLVPGYKQ